MGPGFPPLMGLPSSLQIGITPPAAGVVNRLNCGCHRKMNIPARILESFDVVDEVAQIEILDFRREMSWEIRGVEVRDVANTALARLQRGPHCIDGIPNRSNTADSGNDYSASHHGSLSDRSLGVLRKQQICTLIDSTRRTQGTKRHRLSGTEIIPSPRTIARRQRDPRRGFQVGSSKTRSFSDRRI